MTKVIEVSRTSASQIVVVLVMWSNVTEALLSEGLTDDSECVRRTQLGGCSIIVVGDLICHTALKYSMHVSASKYNIIPYS